MCSSVIITIISSIYHLCKIPSSSTSLSCLSDRFPLEVWSHYGEGGWRRSRALIGSWISTSCLRLLSRSPIGLKLLTSAERNLLIQDPFHWPSLSRSAFCDRTVHLPHGLGPNPRHRDKCITVIFIYCRQTHEGRHGLQTRQSVSLNMQPIQRGHEQNPRTGHDLGKKSKYKKKK